MLNFHIYDVFTDTPFTGNPLAIVEQADTLTTAQMQTIARQFNLSETIFIQTPDDPTHTAKVRIFFPTAEIPFAGHPTIGCALHLAGADTALITLEEVAGLVPVTITRDGPTPRAEFTTPKLPTPRKAVTDRPLAALAIGLSPDDLSPHCISNYEAGPAFIFAGLTDLRALARAHVSEPAFAKLVAAAGTNAIYLYTQTGPNAFRARMFHPNAGVAEDPATGSATAIFAAQLNANGALPEVGTTTLHLEQGVEMGRPSNLRLTIDTDAGDITAIRVAGQAVKIAHGQIRIPHVPA
ncbi:MAG TPA: PhzF family phenazine biosynthesis protein [Roseibacterium sp.]|nr:PhzF family phenazine biosynthesis protein [Roseibacterium sp.]